MPVTPVEWGNRLMGASGKPAWWCSHRHLVRHVCGTRGPRQRRHCGEDDSASHLLCPPHHWQFALSVVTVLFLVFSGQVQQFLIDL